MKKLIHITLYLIVIISSCSKPDEFYDGPNLYDVYGDFEIYSPLEEAKQMLISHLVKLYSLTVN